MSVALHSSKALLAVVLAAFLTGCPEKPTGTESAAASSAPATTAAPAPPPSKPAPKAEPLKPRDDCPEGSAGPGTFKQPCDAKGDVRIMDVKWTKKISDAGPTFSVQSKAKKVILFGAIVVYFYDKDGKQLELKVGDKTQKKQRCTGRIFAGVMKPNEKATLTFSCVKKSHVPEGTETIEGEMQMVGFADASGKKTDYYWRNDDIAPEDRPKGGVKAAAK